MSLLHGSQPDVIVVCHDAARQTMLGYPDYPMPSVEEVIAENLRLGARTNAAIRCGGVTINTSSLMPAEAETLLDREAGRLRLPVADPIRGGDRFEHLLDSCLG